MNPALTKLLGEAGAMAPPLKILALLTILSLLPAIMLTMTSFVRTVVVLSFLRQGMGTQQSPPTQVIVGLALFLTAFTMSPVAQQIRTTALDPYTSGKIDDVQAFNAAISPLRNFMLRQTRQADLELFYSATHADLPQTPDDVSLTIAIPAFVLMSMGMMMVPPTTLALPIKLLLFVLADGWNLVVGSLLQSFR
jgi:flagellar biosynthetic protein FliP